nr:MAG TPA: hypothetical protein [Caudoviricetes sp.]
MRYKNFDKDFNYQQTYSVVAYPWIKTVKRTGSIPIPSYRDRLGD